MSVKTPHHTDEWTILLADRESEDAVPSGTDFRLLQKPRREHAETLRNLFVLCAASELGKISDLVSAVNRRHHLRALFVRQDADPEWLPQLFDRANLRMLRNTLVHSDISVPKRVLTAWKHRAEKELIANATVVDDRLFVISCEPETYELAFDSLPSLRKLRPHQRSNFAVSQDGSYIHWPDPDIHLDIDAIRSVLDPNWRDESAAKKVAHDAFYGQSIAELRRQKGLRQSDIPGLSDRQVRRIEGGEGLTSAALRFLAAAHDMDLDRYLAAVANASQTDAVEPPQETVVA